MDPELAVACSDLAEELAAAAPEDRAVLLLAAAVTKSGVGNFLTKKVWQLFDKKSLATF